MKNLMTLCCLFLMTGLQMQAQNHNDVAVIINQNSPTSIAIGEYFQTQRDIPETNIIRIEAPTTEVISMEEAIPIFEQIKTQLTTNELAESINYLVTTKGLPFIIEMGSDCEEPSICKVSLENRLTCLLSEHEDQITEIGVIPNPYAAEKTAFSRAEYDIFLVSRLDAYTQESVFQLIDRSSSQINTNEEEATIVLDLVNAGSPSVYNVMDMQYTNLQEDIMAANWSNTIYDADESPVLTQENTLWYHTVGNGPYDFFEPSSNWQAGAVGMIHTCYSAPTFEANNDGKLHIADLIESGASGGLGFIDLTYLSELKPIHFFEAYFVENLNLAEANYSALNRLGLSSVIIGDPKTSIVVESPNGTKAPIIGDLNVYPNPSEGLFTIDLIAEMGKIESIEVFNTVGALVYKDTYVAQEGLSAVLDLDGFSSGMYQTILKTEGGVYRQSLVIE